jgi:hypothetical protein
MALRLSGLRFLESFVLTNQQLRLMIYGICTPLSGNCAELRLMALRLSGLRFLKSCELTNQQLRNL